MLLRLSVRERAGLSWVRQWARQQLTQAKRRRKYRPRESVFDADEAEILQALVDLEQAVSQLLTLYVPCLQQGRKRIHLDDDH